MGDREKISRVCHSIIRLRSCLILAMSLIAVRTVKRVHLERLTSVGPVRLCMSKHTSNEVGWWSGKVSSEEPKAKRYAGIG